MQLVAALVAGGAGLPVPEELVLAGGGYCVWRGDADLAAMLAAAWLAVLAGDAMLYTVGRLAGRVAPLRRLVGEERLARLARTFAQHGPPMIVVSRFVPGLRAGFLLAAGSARMRPLKLALVDALAACASVGLWFALGARLGPQIDRLRAAFAGARLVAPLLVVSVAAGLAIRSAARARRGESGRRP